MLKLRRLKIHQFPRVLAGTELVFNDGQNVLLGINGSGKTTLLKLAVLVLSGHFTLASLRTGEFHLEWDIDDADLSATVIVQHRPMRDATSQHDGADSRVEIVVRRAGQTTTIVHQGFLVTTTRDGRTSEARAPAPAPLLPLNFLAADVATDLLACDIDRMDEALQWLEGATRAAHVSILQDSNLRPTSCPPLQRWLEPLLQGRPETSVYELTSAQVPFLATAADALNFARISLLFDLQQKQRSESTDRWIHTYGNFRFSLVKADGTQLSQDQLSFGQQRLLGFFYYAALHPDVMIVDELCNGMHHAMLDRCIDEIDARQALLATQNPLLVDRIGFADVEQVRRTFILCTTTLAHGREHMAWRNMTAAEAERFFRDYKVGISHVNEILRSWGLW